MFKAVTRGESFQNEVSYRGEKPEKCLPNFADDQISLIFYLVIAPSHANCSSLIFLM